MNNFKSIATTLAILGTGAIMTTGCKKDSATETPGGSDAAAEDKAEGSCGGAEGSCGASHEEEALAPADAEEPDAGAEEQDLGPE